MKEAPVRRDAAVLAFRCEPAHRAKDADPAPSLARSALAREALVRQALVREALVREEQHPYGASPRMSGRIRSRSRHLPEVKATITPGQKGTRRLLARFGKQLLCVRYRYDRKRGVRLTTIELVVAEKQAKRTAPEREPAARPKVAIQLASWEEHLRNLILRAGGTWNAEHKVWLIERRQAIRLGLRFRMQTLAQIRAPRAAGHPRYHTPHAHQGT